MKTQLNPLGTISSPSILIFNEISVFRIINDGYGISGSRRAVDSETCARRVGHLDGPVEDSFSCRVTVGGFVVSVVVVAKGPRISRICEE